MLRTLRFHCWGPRFDPWLGNQDLTSCVARKERKEERKERERKKKTVETSTMTS